MLAALSEAAIAPRAVEQIILRPPAPDDFDALAEIRRDRDMQTLLLAVIEATDDAAVREWIARRTNNASGVFRVVADGASGAVLGYVQIADIHRHNRYGYLGIAIRRGAQRQGVGKAALRLLHELARTEVDLEKLLLTVRADNVLAIKMYLDAGYRVVGILESHFRDYEGACHDVLLLERALDEA
ncbi:GNAT family N-acetyltransferase [Hyphomicrobium sp. CS1GBMeth3]|uniref:GNAT family N-acetyltransferase n=1 Tax=Hyphomicrobium sp. CS1GBMeth3 TaxID=1892845 RepID=UPI00092FE5B4|nr:GNAT family N-acetyltransferase [Hyphomicrobium sp. CS1GBMeth3]